MITIDKAIEILTYHEPSLTFDETPDIRQALKLGIEALKVLRHGRKIGSHYDPALLPGETEE